MIELQVLRCFTRDRDKVLQYGEKIKGMTLDKEIMLILKLISTYYIKYPDHKFVSKDELLAWFDYHYPKSKKRDSVDGMLTTIYEQDTSDSLAVDVIHKLITKDFGVRVLNLLLPMLNDEVDAGVIEEVRRQIADCEASLGEQDNVATPYVDNTLQELLDQKQTDGLTFPLHCLDADLGRLTGNTLGHFFAVPDAGKTSFIHFLVSKLCRQLTGTQTVVWFNNEEGGRKVKLRFFSAVCGATEAQIIENPRRAEELFKERYGGKMLLYDKAIITVQEIEQECIKHNTRLAVVDIGDKIQYKGRSAKGNGADALQGVYDTLREVTKRINLHHKFDMLTTGQAGTTAENKKWLQQSDLYAGKTGKAGAMDYIIGMGSLDSTPLRRYISLCKNKLGTQSLKYDITFDPLRASFRD